MHQFRVEIDGVAVWSGEFADDSVKNFPAEYLNRPADAVPYPPAHYLYLDDEIIGVQICQAQETEGN